MPRFSFFCVLCLLLAASLTSSAEDTPVPLAYERLDLNNGRKLKKVLIKSYDEATGKVLLVTEGKAIVISIELVPEPFRAKLKEEAPRSGSSMTSVTMKTPPVAGQPAMGAKVTPYGTFNTPRAIVQAAPVPLTVSPTNAHLNAALTRATQYYQYEYPVGSSAVRMTASNISVDEIDTVTGWEGRHRARGKAFLEFFDSKGRSFKRATSTFEVITEYKPGELMKVIDFTIKS